MAWQFKKLDITSAVDSPKIRLSGSVSVCIPFLLSLIDHNSKLQLPLQEIEMGKEIEMLWKPRRH